MKTEPKERPILFSAPMVLAVLDGTKTQTRRIAKFNASGRLQLAGGKQWHPEDPNAYLASPYGQPGDRLWVKETWKPHFDAPALWTCIKYRADGAMIKPRRWSANEGFWVEQREEETRWYPSIFMRRSFSRITLEITEVRVERLQDITEADAEAEGVAASMSIGYYNILGVGGKNRQVVEGFVGGIPKAGDEWQGIKVEHIQHVPPRQTGSARTAYRDLWNRINGPDAWNVNPWVWVVGFKRVEGGAS